MKAKQSIFLFLGLTLIMFSCKKEEQNPANDAFKFTYVNDFSFLPSNSAPVGILYLLDANGTVLDEEQILNDTKSITLSTAKEGDYSVAIVQRSFLDGFNFNVVHHVPNNSAWNNFASVFGKNEGVSSITSTINIENMPAFDSLSAIYHAQNASFSHDASSKFFSTTPLSLQLYDYAFVAVRTEKTSPFRYSLVKRPSANLGGAITLKLDFEQMKECKTATLKFKEKDNHSYNIVGKTANGLAYLASRFSYYLDKGWTEKQILLPEEQISDYYVKYNQQYDHLTTLDKVHEGVASQIETLPQANGTNLYQTTKKDKIMLLRGTVYNDISATRKLQTTYSICQYSDSGVGFRDDNIPDIPESAKKLFPELKDTKKPKDFWASFVGFKNKNVSYKEYLDYIYTNDDFFNSPPFNSWLYDIGFYTVY
jgi:hypothetical protein